MKIAIEEIESSFFQKQQIAQERVKQQKERLQSKAIEGGKTAKQKAIERRAARASANPEQEENEAEDEDKM